MALATGLLTEYELRLLGAGLSHAWPIDEAPCFEGLLAKIDKADRQLWRQRDRSGSAQFPLPC